jgi:MoxR-like ATPase
MPGALRIRMRFLDATKTPMPYASQVIPLDASPGDDADFAEATRLSKSLVANVGSVLLGKEDVAELAVVCLLARGHLLIEDVPGVGKTTLARALAASLGLELRRLQCTSDLMPSDVTGGSVYDAKSQSFSFRPGPVFTQVLLADEINRTTPKTQSALLEAMDEGQVSVDGVTHPLPRPFFVVATQNPEEFHGTYPLPESQLDRFLLRLQIGHPPPDVEKAILRSRGATDPVAALSAVAGSEALSRAQDTVHRVHLADVVIDYLHALVAGTRTSKLLAYGASTRAALALARAVKARALVLGRTHVTPDDVKALALPALAHRVRAENPSMGTAAREDAERAVRELAAEVPVPL